MLISLSMSPSNALGGSVVVDIGETKQRPIIQFGHEIRDRHSSVVIPRFRVCPPLLLYLLNSLLIAYPSRQVHPLGKKKKSVAIRDLRTNVS